MRLRRRSLLCAASAVLWVATWPPWSLWPLTFVAFVPLLLALAGAPLREAAVLGTLFGALAAALGLSWIQAVLASFMGGDAFLGALMTVGVLSVLAARFAAAAVLFATSSPHAPGRWPSLAWAPCLVVLEGVTAPLLPWATAYSLGRAPFVAQAVDVGGVLFVSGALALVNGLVASAIGPSPSSARRFGFIAAAMSIAGALAGYGAMRARELDSTAATAPRLRVSIAQGNTASEAQEDDARVAYRTVSAPIFGDGTVDMLVWPETALRAPLLAHDLTRGLMGRVPELSFAAPALLTGALVQHDEGVRNEAILGGRGVATQAYAKVDSMPFGEHLPLGEVFPFLYRLFPRAGRVVAAETPLPLVVRGHTLQARICYEELLPWATWSAMRANRGELLVGLVNDAWFGEGPAAEFHRTAARFRAIEHGRYLVRAVNNGPSGIVDARGGDVATIPAGERGVLVASVPLLTTLTLYARFGDAPTFATAIALVLIALLRRRERPALAPRARRHTLCR